MRKLLVVLIAMFVCTTILANESNVTKDRMLIAYSTGEGSVEYVTKTISNHLEENLTFYLGFNINHELSEVRISNNISKKDFTLIKEVFTEGNTCITRCARANGCSDKPSNSGAIGCYAECIIDCAAELINPN